MLTVASCSGEVLDLLTGSLATTPVEVLSLLPRPLVTTLSALFVAATVEAVVVVVMAFEDASFCLSLVVILSSAVSIFWLEGEVVVVLADFKFVSLARTISLAEVLVCCSLLAMAGS